MGKLFTGRISLAISAVLAAANFSLAPTIAFAGSGEILNAGSETSFVYSTPEVAAAGILEVSTVTSYEEAGAALASGKTYYLAADQVQTADFPAPPASRSPEDKADLAVVLQWQKDRTPAQCAAANAQANESYAVFFGEINPFPSPMPKEAAAFFQRVQSDGGAADRYLKDLYRRPRPFQQNTSVDPCLGRIGGYSYPSGHATAAYLFGLILSSLVPQDGPRFAAYADQAALNRVIGGVHYPSDVKAGKLLADDVYLKLRQNPDFVSDMDALKKYLAR